MKQQALLITFPSFISVLDMTKGKWFCESIAILIRYFVVIYIFLIYVIISIIICNHRRISYLSSRICSTFRILYVIATLHHLFEFAIEKQINGCIFRCKSIFSQRHFLFTVFFFHKIPISFIAIDFWHLIKLPSIRIFIKEWKKKEKSTAILKNSKYY